MQVIEEKRAGVQRENEQRSVLPGHTNCGIVIEGGALQHALEPENQDLLMALCKDCKAVVCCRVTPMQKAQVCGPHGLQLVGHAHACVAAGRESQLRTVLGSFQVQVAPLFWSAGSPTTSFKALAIKHCAGTRVDGAAGGVYLGPAYCSDQFQGRWSGRALHVTDPLATLTPTCCFVPESPADHAHGEEEGWCHHAGHR